MSDKYAKNCHIQTITPQDLSPVAVFVAKNTINQMGLMCVDYLTEQLAKAYMDKYSVFMEGQDREYLKTLSSQRCAEFLIEAAKLISQSIDTHKDTQPKLKDSG